MLLRTMEHLSEILERSGLTLRELARRTGMSLGTLSRTANGGRDLSSAEALLVQIAVGDVPAERVVPESAAANGAVPAREHSAKPGIRRCFVCQKCRQRVFLPSEAPPQTIPDCAQHGPMVRQANAPYMGQSTEPSPEQGWPPAKDFPKKVLS